MGNSIKTQIDVYEKAIKEIDEYLSLDITQHKLVKDKKKKIRRLETINHTIKNLNDKKKLKLSKIPQEAINLSVVKSKREEQNTVVNNSFGVVQKKIKEGGYSSVTVAIMVMCIVIIMSVFTSWIQINGMKIGLTEIIDTLEALSNWTSSEEISSVLGVAQILSLATWGVAGLYGVILYQLLCNKEIKLLGWGIVIIGGILMSFFMIGKSMQSEMGVFFPIVNITMSGWLALVLSIVIWILNQNAGNNCELNQVNNAQEKKQEDSQHPNRFSKEMRKYAISNYYPWMSINVINALIKKDEPGCLTFEYSCTFDLLRDAESFIWENAEVYLLVDILFKTEMEDYCIREVPIHILTLLKEGETEPIYVKEIPFSLNRLKCVNVFIKAIDVVNGEVKEYPYVFVDSDLDAEELKKYRETVQKKKAVCKAKIFQTEWQCDCGLINPITEEKCCGCGESKLNVVK